jgi:hypothetical protein
MLLADNEDRTWQSPVVQSARHPAATPQDGKRSLTPGEEAMARKLFRDSLDYARVKVHNHEFLPFGLQPDDTAMTPNGEMYFNQRRFCEDFSAQPDHLRHWFIHEMVHVWQYQLGYLVWLRGAIRIGVGYDYVLEHGKTLGDYNMEAQGDLLADYFALKHLNAPEVMAQGRYANDLNLFEEVLNVFLRNPRDKSNLP